MKPGIISQSIAAMVAGVLGSYLYSVQGAQSWELFYIVYSTIAGLVITCIGKMEPWKWIPLLFLTNYFSGYFFIHNWGQLGPFDLIFMAIYSIPCLGASYLGIYVRKYFRSKTNTIT